MAGSQQFQLGLLYRNPAARLLQAQTRRDPIEIRPVEIQDVRKFVQADMMTIGVTRETPTQFGHGENHCSPVIDLTDAITAAEPVVLIKTIRIQEYFPQLTPFITSPPEAQSDSRRSHQELQI